MSTVKYNKSIFIKYKKYLKFTYIAILILLVTNVITVILLNKTEEQFIAGFQNPYPLIDISRNFVKQENFIVNIQPLRETLYELVDRKQPNLIGIYLEFLNTGANISINQNSRFWPASLSKVPAAMVALKKVQLGEWKLDNELVLFEEDKDSRFGNLYKMPVGTRFTIEELIKEMIINSDNTAFKMFVRNLPGEAFDEMIETLGLEDLYNTEYDISAKEYSRIFRALYNSSFLNREYSQLLLTWLSESDFNRFLQSGVSDEVIFSHKIGEQEEQLTYLDSGIVYLPNRPYLITVLLKVNETQDKELARDIAEEIMSSISKESYDYFTSI